MQFIASGALGDAAFTGGLGAAALGALFHFLISYVVVAIFALAYDRVAAVRSHWAVAGLVWGVIVWAAMNLVVLPLSHVHGAPLTALPVIHGLIGHGLTVGFAGAYTIRRVIAGRGQR